MDIRNYPLFLKSLFLLTVYLLHGRPFVGLVDYGYALLVVCFLLWGIPRKRMGISSAALGLILFVCVNFIPQLAIPEYQRILLNENNDIIAPEEFVRNPSQFPFFLTADGFVQGNYRKRMVSTIEIEQDIRSLRSGWVNRTDFNFDSRVSPLIRDQLPFVVCYRVTPSLVGYSLKVHGKIMVERKGQFAPLELGQNKLIVDASMVDSTLCGFGGKWNENGVQNLQMSLEKTFKQKVFDSIRILFLFIGVGLLFFGLFYIPWSRDLSIQVTLLFLSMSYLFYYYFQDLQWGILAKAGSDGMIHDGFAQLMLEKWASGDWRSALMSPEHVFYFMPGMRYIRFLEMILFGNAYVLQVCLLLFMPIIYYRFFSNFLSQGNSLLLSLLGFIYGLDGIGLSYKLYIVSFLKLYGEGFAYALFFISLNLLIKRVPTIARGFLAFFLIAITLTIRPNLGVFVAVICFIHLFSTTFSPLSWKSRVIMLLGLTPGLLIPIHNILGGEFVLLTKASQIPENLPLLPSTYYQGLCYLFGLSETSQYISKIITHFKEFYPHYWLGWLACLWLSFKGRTGIIRSLAIATVAGLSVHFFYLPIIRYIHPYMTIACTLALCQIPSLRAPSLNRS